MNKYIILALILILGLAALTTYYLSINSSQHSNTNSAETDTQGEVISITDNASITPENIEHVTAALDELLNDHESPADAGERWVKLTEEEMAAKRVADEEKKNESVKKSREAGSRIEVLDGEILLNEFGFKMTVPDRFINFDIIAPTVLYSAPPDQEQNVEYHHTVIYFDDLVDNQVQAFVIRGIKYHLPGNGRHYKSIESQKGNCDQSITCVIEHRTNLYGVELLKQLTSVDHESMVDLRDQVKWMVDIQDPKFALVLFSHLDMTNTELSREFDEMINSIELIE